MTLEQVKRILKENNNIFINHTTMRLLGKRQIEKSVGFKIVTVKQLENGYIYEKVGE